LLIQELNREGALLIESGRYAEAMGRYKAALEQDPEHAPTLCRLGNANLILARRKLQESDPVAAHTYADSATFCFRAALKSAPVDDDAIQGLVQTQEIVERCRRGMIVAARNPPDRTVGN
jgi:tetratricopeptide (TPR) repeat protein